jgi:hypothetical protein
MNSDTYNNILYLSVEMAHDCDIINCRITISDRTSRKPKSEPKRVGINKLSCHASNIIFIILIYDNESYYGTINDIKLLLSGYRV